MPTVEVRLPNHRYDVVVESGLLERLGGILRSLVPHRRCALILDQNLEHDYQPGVIRSLQAGGYEPMVASFPTSEKLKSLTTVGHMLNQLAEARIERRSPLIAMGGGILTDTAGFAAASWLRGVPLVMVPTTLLAMVDASVGGKTGVNLPQGKNLVGAFYQPVLVTIDPTVLKTLPPREIRCGLAECVKHGMIRDPELLTWLEEQLDAVMQLEPQAMETLIQWNVAIKARVVMADEKESGERAHLNFGHTFAHAIEAAQGDLPADRRFHHGEAVALGMVAATRLAVNLGRIPADIGQRLETLLTRIGLPVTTDCLPESRQMLEWMRLDKKVSDDRIRLILPTAVGSVEIDSSIKDDKVCQAWDSLRS